MAEAVKQILTHSHRMTPFDWFGKDAFWKHCRKRRYCLYKKFFFPKCFLLYQRQKLSFLLYLICRLQMLSILSGPKFCRVENFRLFQTQRLCRRQFQIWWKWRKVIQKVRKHCGGKEKLLFMSNFSFSYSVFKRLVLQTRKRKVCLGKG